MVIIKADLLQEKKEILNEIPLLLEWVTLSSKVLIDNLEFHTESRSRFGLLSTTFLIAQRFFLLELQISYLRCPYDTKKKKVLMLKGNGSMSGMQTASTFIIIISMIFGNLGKQLSAFSISMELVV